jgi:hypothetical protein
MSDSTPTLATLKCVCGDMFRRGILDYYCPFHGYVWVVDETQTDVFVDGWTCAKCGCWVQAGTRHDH